jgi:hypothetical protein
MQRRNFLALAAVAPLPRQQSSPVNHCVNRAILAYTGSIPQNPGGLYPHEPWDGKPRWVGLDVCRWCSCGFWHGEA